MSTISAIHDPSEVWKEYSLRGGWDSVSDFHRITNMRLYQIATAIISDEVGSMLPEKQYAYLFQILRSIELEEASLINLLKRNSFRRLWMDRFRASLPAKVAKEVVPHELRAIFERATSSAKTN
jgi:hypothetical protein